MRFYLCDHLGTPNALLSQSGEIDWAAQLDAWGNVMQEYNPHGLYQPIRLPGQHQDPDTGLYYNRHRYYEPKLGRYINQDPIGLSGGYNSYGYPLRPLEIIDSLGLQAQICTRNLKLFPTWRTYGGTGLDLGIFHEHIFYKNGDNVGYGDDGIFKEDSKAGYICGSLEYDEDIMREAVLRVRNKKTFDLLNPRNPYAFEYSESQYNILTNNCQDFVTDVLGEYRAVENLKRIGDIGK